MDERNAGGVVLCLLMIIGFVVAVFFIMRSDKNRVDNIDVSEEREILKKREKELEEKSNNKDKEKKEKELSTFNSFELNYKTDMDPISTYYIKVDEDRNLTSTINEKCSKEITCEEVFESYHLALTDYEYRLILKVYNELYTKEWPNETKGSFAVIVARMAIGNKTMYDNNTNGWGMYEMYDSDIDGRVTYREYGTYALEIFNY